MSDSYQAIYDAVRSRISSGNIADALQDFLRESFDISQEKQQIFEDFSTSAAEQQRPFALLKPSISIDGNKWCALYGENLQDGVAGFGDTPESAARDFDNSWYNMKAKK